MIYSPKAQPEVNKSHIPEVPTNNRLIFHMGEVSTGSCVHPFIRAFARSFVYQRKTIRNTLFFVVLMSIR